MINASVKNPFLIQIQQKHVDEYGAWKDAKTIAG